MPTTNHHHGVANARSTRQDGGDTTTPPLLMCYNRNCYKTFANAKGLSVHISKAASCREFVSRQNLMATINRSFVSTKNAHNHRGAYGSSTMCFPTTLNWYNTQGQRLNPHAHLLPHLLPRHSTPATSIGQITTSSEPNMHLIPERPAQPHCMAAGTRQEVAHDNDSSNTTSTEDDINTNDKGHAAASLGSLKRAHGDIDATSTPSSPGTTSDDDEFMVTLDHFNVADANILLAQEDDDQRLIVDQRPSALSQAIQNSQHAPSDPCTTIYSQAVFNAAMECARAKQNETIQLLQHDVEHKCIVELMSLLESLQCPDYALEKILHWAHHAQQQQFSFTPRAYTREANIQWMYKLLRNSHQRLPFLQVVELEDHTIPQQVVCFDFGIALLSLLQDQMLMQLDNLVINPLDPLALFHPTNNRLGEANTGQRYRELYSELITDTKRQLLAPIILYLDATAIDGKGRLEVCPVSFTCSLFTEEVRRSVTAWRMLGYVPDLNRLRSNAMNAHANNAFPKGRTTRNLHKMLDAILGGMSHAQQGKDTRLLNVPIKIGHQWLFVDIVCPLLFVINDGKQGDQLCGRFNGHHRSTIRHHRSCNCCFEDLDNPNVTCTFLNAHDVDRISRHGSDNDRQQLSVYKVNNCFNRIEMGGNPHGIFMCAVIDVMHTVQHGVIKYALEVFLSHLNNAQKVTFDRLAITFDHTCRQSIRQDYPHTNFGRGITNLTNITCTEYSGLLFLVTAICVHEDGWNIMDAIFPAQRQATAIQCTLECLVCFEAWLGKDTYWRFDEAETCMHGAESAIRSLMLKVTSHLPRHTGYGWKVSKFHELLHIPRLMMAFGATKGYSAARPEAHHKEHAKQPGRRSQKRIRHFDQQCATRVADAFVIKSTMQLFSDNPPLPAASPLLPSQQASPPGLAPQNHDDTTTCDTAAFSSTYLLTSYIDEATAELCYYVHLVNGSATPIELEPNLEFFLMDYYREQWDAETGVGSLMLRTEYRRHAQNGECLIHIRCHPDYRRNGPWYDWALIRFEDDAGNCTDYPSRILACIPRQQQQNHTVHPTEDAPLFELVVQCCSVPTDAQRSLLLFTAWEFCHDFYVVEASALVGACFVVPACSDMSRVLVVQDRSQWPSLFLKACQ